MSQLENAIRIHGRVDVDVTKYIPVIIIVNFFRRAGGESVAGAVTVASTGTAPPASTRRIIIIPCAIWYSITSSRCRECLICDEDEDDEESPPRTLSCNRNVFSRNSQRSLQSSLSCCRFAATRRCEDVCLSKGSYCFTPQRRTLCLLGLATFIHSLA